MSPTPSPIAAAQIIARNLTPLAGILFFGWPAANVALLYLLDTLLALAVIVIGLMSVFARLEDGLASRINGVVGAFATGAALVAVMAIPLGMPLMFVLAAADFSWREALADPSLRFGAATQAAAALWSYVGLWHALADHSPEALQLKRRFALVLLRWLGVMMLIFTGVGLLGGPLVVVAAYVGLSIWAEIAPDRFLRAMPGGAADALPEGADANAQSAPQQKRRRLRGRHRH